MQKYVNYIVLIALAIAILFIQECRHQNQTDNLITDVVEYHDTAYIEVVDGMEVARNNVLVLQNQKQVIALLEKDKDYAILLKKYKNFDAVGQITEVTKIVHDTVRLVDSIPCDFEPLPITKIDSNYQLYATIEPSLFTLDSMFIPNKIKFTVGTKKVGLFKKEKTIEVINTNPLVHTTSLSAYTITEKKKWYQTQWFSALVGAGVTFFAMKP